MHTCSVWGDLVAGRVSSHRILGLLVESHGLLPFTCNREGLATASLRRRMGRGPWIIAEGCVLDRVSCRCVVIDCFIGSRYLCRMEAGQGSSCERSTKRSKHDVMPHAICGELWRDERVIRASRPEEPKRARWSEEARRKGRRSWYQYRMQVSHVSSFVYSCSTPKGTGAVYITSIKRRPSRIAS